MDNWKLAVLVLFGTVAGLGVNYAHSAGQQSIEWRSNVWLGSCGLKAEKAGGAAWNFVALGHSRTRFASTWPNVPGEMFLSSGPKYQPGELLVGADAPMPTETLSIKFDLVEGKPEPVSYTYDNVKNRLATKGLISPVNCSLQRKKR